MTANGGAPRIVTLALLVSAALVASVAGVARAQLYIPKAELTPTVETSPIRPGATATLRLGVELEDESLHVQSDEPRDPLLIPTLLTLDPPEGVTVEAITYPPAEDLEQSGADQPLAVFPHAFSIDVRVALAAGVSPGEVAMPGNLEYQACDDTMCYAPTDVDTSWTLRVEAR